MKISLFERNVHKEHYGQNYIYLMNKLPKQDYISLSEILTNFY